MEGEDDNKNMMMSKFMVGSIPSVYYIPDFITEQEQVQLLDNITHAPIAKWKSLKNRRLQNWGGVVHEKGLLPQDLPPWLTNMTLRISKASMGFFPCAINHVLINEYLPDQGIMPHQDGPAYFPVVAILSLESPVVMDFTPHSLPSSSSSNNNNTPFSVLLMPRSLLIFKDQAYSDYLHGIKDCEVHHFKESVNLTDRDLKRLLEREEGNATEIHRST
ncbi:LOW QUALITY PROTEIN: alpha-ketoglutarate-dependent dioxygenase alkB homolog 6-like [Impatiens glandulifera]|uniref:LOW QUALITY PROTEIN: alpha-ketoglutarate-dependent dioxygenase alkB homolog 6-like n=1 Tax=Impatiens glandulifera TaxID=253017 RepID=UPI001FB17C27|nr:LOW QUALITY PROTEIN: alpha-ketoglutarate-dependent dioxygenase alkB homolog 6-like [Impatiens glandulifera]